MSPVFPAAEGNMEPGGMEKQEMVKRKAYTYCYLNGIYATLVMWQEKRKNKMQCLHIVCSIKSPEKNREMDPKCRMWDIHSLLLLPCAWKRGHHAAAGTIPKQGTVTLESSLPPASSGQIASEGVVLLLLSVLTSLVLPFCILLAPAGNLWPHLQSK